MSLNPAHGRGQVARIPRVEYFSDFRKPFFGWRFKPDEYTYTAGLGRELEKFIIIGHVYGHLCNPPLAKLGTNHRLEQRLRALDVFGCRTDEIVVDNENTSLSDCCELCDDIANRLLPVAVTVECGHAAETAA